MASRPAKCVCMQCMGQKLCKLQSRLQHLCWEVDSSSNFQSFFNTSDAPDTPPVLCISLWMPQLALPACAAFSSKQVTSEEQCCGSKQPCRTYCHLLADCEIKGFHYILKVSICRLNKYFRCSFLLFFLACSRKKWKGYLTGGQTSHLTSLGRK